MCVTYLVGLLRLRAEWIVGLSLGGIVLLGGAGAAAWLWIRKDKDKKDKDKKK